MSILPITLSCLAVLSGPADHTLVLNDSVDLRVFGVAATTYSFRTETPDSMRAGDKAEHTAGIPVSRDGWMLQVARLALRGKITDRVGGYVHIAGNVNKLNGNKVVGNKLSWEGYLDASPFDGFTVRIGRWLQQTGPIAGRRVAQRHFVDRSLPGETFFGPGGLNETGLMLHYAGPYKALPFALSLSILGGANTHSFGLSESTADAVSHTGIGTDSFKRMAYLMRLSMNPGALFGQQLTVGAFFAKGKNNTGGDSGNGNDTDVFGFDLGTQQQFGAIGLGVQTEFVLRNYGVPEALNAMDGMALEVVTTYKQCEVALRYDMLGLLTAEPTPEFGDDKKWRFSTAATYRLGSFTFLRAQYNGRNDTVSGKTGHEFWLQGIVKLGTVLGGAAESQPAPQPAPQPPAQPAPQPAPQPAAQPVAPPAPPAKRVDTPRPSEPQSSDPGDWLKAAQTDLTLAKTLSGQSRHAHACFACQQAAQKSLRAAVLKTKTPLNSNVRGATAAADALTRAGNALPENVASAIRELDRHFSTSRYPSVLGGGPERYYDALASTRAQALAATIMTWAGSI